MSDFNAFVSPEYPVLHTVLSAEETPDDVPDGFSAISLALLVKGIPSFLATIPVATEDVGRITRSLEAGDVRVAVVGMSVEEKDVLEAEGGPEEPWKASSPVLEGLDDADAGEMLPAAFLSLVCRDGRRIGVARIVARQGSASPEEVARFVLKQIARGVQIPDLAQAG